MVPFNSLIRHDLAHIGRSPQALADSNFREKAPCTEEILYGAD